MAEGDLPIRIAAIGDLHYTRASQGVLEPLFAQVSGIADVLVLCGDLTDYGLPEEAQALARDLGAARVPVLAVLGNHDVESGRGDEVTEILRNAGVQVLDGDGCVVRGVGFAGAKGFCGGFGRRALEPWGEPIIKAFVREALDETMKLERALARLRTEHRVAILHYSPVQATVEGEPIEIFPFLGSSRLEEPINRYEASLVFHGHVHHGSPEGRTAAGVPVYNVALPLLRRTIRDAPPVRVITLGVSEAAAAISECPVDVSDPAASGGPH